MQVILLDQEKQHSCRLSLCSRMIKDINMSSCQTVRFHGSVDTPDGGKMLFVFVHMYTYTHLYTCGKTSQSIPVTIVTTSHLRLFCTADTRINYKQQNCEYLRFE